MLHQYGHRWIVSRPLEFLDDLGYLAVRPAARTTQQAGLVDQSKSSLVNAVHATIIPHYIPSLLRTLHSISSVVWVQVMARSSCFSPYAPLPAQRLPGCRERERESAAEWV